MASSVSAQLLKQLSSASEGLNNVSDIFNGEIKVIEEALASYNLGVHAWVEACILNEEYYGKDGVPLGVQERKIMVGYEKWNGKWCLMASSHTRDDEYPGDLQQWILRDAPRDVRLKAIEGIPKLLEKLIEEAKELTAEITKKTTEARMLGISIKPKAKGQ
jgi:hypothetical protein